MEFIAQWRQHQSCLLLPCPAPSSCSLSIPLCIPSTFSLYLFYSLPLSQSLSLPLSNSSTFSFSSSKYLLFSLHLFQFIFVPLHMFYSSFSFRFVTFQHSFHLSHSSCYYILHLLAIMFILTRSRRASSCVFSLRTSLTSAN